MKQLSENRGPGRPSPYDRFAHLNWEAVWIGQFCGLRNGMPAERVERRGSSGLFIKASYDQKTVFVDTSDGTKEVPGRQTLYSSIPGQKPHVIEQPKFTESPSEIEHWEKDAQAFHENFQQTVSGDIPIMETTPGIPAERHIWDTLLSATNAKQVRRAVAQSKFWLRSRVETGKGEYIDLSWYAFPNALNWHAELFCKSKLGERYPRKDARATGDYRRMEYLGRVMAGLSFNPILRPSYSVELLRKMKHGEDCFCWRCRCGIEPRFPRTLIDFLLEKFPE